MEYAPLNNMPTDNISIQMGSILVNNSRDLSTNSHQQICNDRVRPNPIKELLSGINEQETYWNNLQFCQQDGGRTEGIYLWQRCQ